MNAIKNGLTAGFIATVVLSFFMVMKGMMGVMPQLNPIQDILTVLDGFTGVEWPYQVGWMGHFFIGTVAWGIVYGFMQPHLPGSPMVRGLIFGALAWLAMMILFMPLAGHGFFGMDLGVGAVVATLVLHLIYGGVLGASFSRIAAISKVQQRA